MRVCVTGASGGVGQSLVAALRARGDQVSALVRADADSKALATLRRLDCRLIEGDVADEAAIVRAAMGADVFFHLAAVLSDFARKADCLRINAERAGVRRFVHLSSTAVYGVPDTDRVTEDTPTRYAGVPYHDSKVDAEREVFAFGERGAFEVVVLRPAAVYGPHDRMFLPRIARFLRKGRFAYPGSESLPLNVVHVDNVVDVALMAATHPKAKGQAFNITDGEALPLGQFVRLVCRAIDVPPPWLTVPMPLARMALRVIEGAYRVVRAKAPPSVTGFTVQWLARRAVYSCDKASALLGYRPRYTVPEAIDRVVRELAPAA
jgi:nucleoside-diphosphate-sugar epimerase